MIIFGKICKKRTLKTLHSDSLLLTFTFTLMTCSQKEAIVYHEWYYSLSWMILLKKRELLCILFSILQATLPIKPRRRQETTSAKNVRTLLQKESFQNRTKNCCGIGIYQTRISNFKTVIFFFFHPSSQSKVDANVFENKKTSRACVQDVSSKTAEKKEETQQNSTCSIYVWICSTTSWPRNYIANEEKPLDIKKTSPPASLSMLG